MLEPREADIPFLFLVLVVLPVVTYILLGKWSETSDKRDRVSLLAQLAAEETLRAETMAAASVIPVASPSKNNVLHVCAMCFSPSTTRCSRCKSVRYCSGNCQIIHWRQIHKDECVPVETCSVSSPMHLKDSVLHYDDTDSPFHGYNIKQAVRQKAASSKSANSSASVVESGSLDCSNGDTSHNSMVGRRTAEKRFSFIFNSESSRRENNIGFDSSDELFQNEAACMAFPVNGASKDARHRHKARNSDCFASEEILERHNNGGTSSICLKKQTSARNATQESFKNKGHNENMAELRRSSSQVKGERTARLSKSTTRKSGEHLYADNVRKEQMPCESEVNGVASFKILKMMGLKKSTKLAKQNASEKYDVTCKRIKMLFPYEEFVKFFQCEVFCLSPRGLVNCGNSCYANAVLQCLTCTKPLVAYLLQRSHSRICHGKDWCLLCELEQHVMLLRESGAPLSPSRILSHMRSINCQIGNGSQEDAHEFLRLLVASMQSICLEGLGGESKVDPRLQETTFVQHTFGGRLRSKVKCLRCHHESERYENIMDLSLEIYGWVESLEDALTQFTTPEDLDGENMYRCGSCAEYVRARKQLSIHEAPNILTIVLKRFQEGRYGKINKCITFPDMLDMIPFMTGAGDVPPLYVLYAVVVHLDTLNASFSGHYVSYVKDLRGNWFRIDDAEVRPVPKSQVMSEGAYILFYMRSYPRPQRPNNSKSQRLQTPAAVKVCQSRNQKPPLQEHRKPVNHFIGTASTSDHFRSKTMENIEFSDATASDWSLFTSSDESSFTTESTRDSFSTVDYTDACNSDPFSFFNTSYNTEPSSRNTFACRMISGAKPQTMFFSEANSNCSLSSDGNYCLSVNYGTNPEEYCLDRTYSYR